MGQIWPIGLKGLTLSDPFFRTLSISKEEIFFLCRPTTQQLLNTSKSETSSTSKSSASDFDENLRSCKGYMFYQLKLVLGLKDKLNLHPPDSAAIN